MQGKQGTLRQLAMQMTLRSWAQKKMMSVSHEAAGMRNHVKSLMGQEKNRVVVESWNVVEVGSHQAGHGKWIEDDFAFVLNFESWGQIVAFVVKFGMHELKSPSSSHCFLTYCVNSPTGSGMPFGRVNLWESLSPRMTWSFTVDEVAKASQSLNEEMSEVDENKRINMPKGRHLQIHQAQSSSFPGCTLA